jgi:hypothetical protein
LRRRGGGEEDVLDKVVPVHDIFRHVFYGILEEERISLTEFRSALSLIKFNLVH